MSKTVTIEYFALLREARGCAREKRETDAATPRVLYGDLRARFRLPISAEAMRVAVNGAFASWDVPLHDNDTVAFIPPVAGG
ncbi:MAG TPA: MoaD/ThiS family protein [Candidatus Hydrogenedentes bacterium]|nr:MoaD/ThiS family protein [Candidatus Hydrogenedentota bacterium]